MDAKCLEHATFLFYYFYIRTQVLALFMWSLETHIILFNPFSQRRHWPPWINSSYVAVVVNLRGCKCEAKSRMALEHSATETPLKTNAWCDEKYYQMLWTWVISTNSDGVSICQEYIFFWMGRVVENVLFFLVLLCACKFVARVCQGIFRSRCNCWATDMPLLV